MISRCPVLPLLALTLLLGACSSYPTANSRPAPIESRTSSAAKPVVMGGVRPKVPGKAVEREPDWRPKTHLVGKGDTLYSIALEYGLDYRELAQWNGLVDANVISVGQQLRLSADEVASNGVVVKPLPPKKPLQPAAVVSDVAVTYPRALKLPWSDTALAELQRQLQVPAVTPAVVATPVIATPLPDTSVDNKNRPEKTASPAEVKNPAVNTNKFENDASGDDEALEWVFPTQGKLLSGYSEKGNKGWDIGGKKGQAIFSASVGKVVYSGTGLRGYGKLIIVKHNKTYLSAYAHNQVILVKEGDNVIKGQKIAEMGDTDSDTVKLHFEIRRFGRPVDPSKYMPAETKP